MIEKTNNHLGLLACPQYRPVLRGNDPFNHCGRWRSDICGNGYYKRRLVRYLTNVKRISRGSWTDLSRSPPEHGLKFITRLLELPTRNKLPGFKSSSAGRSIQRRRMYPATSA